MNDERRTWNAERLLPPKSRESRAEMRVRVVPELGDERMTVEHGLDDGALHALASAMDQPNLGETGLVRRVHKLFDDGRNICGQKGVEIELVFDRNLLHARANRAMTVVVMPPRAVKAPVTVMRRGWQAATRSSRMLFVAAS